MIGWYTDNQLSHTVLSSIPDIELRHIRDFHPQNNQHVFYGILRGSSRAMHILRQYQLNYHYIDNGYFDALYVNKHMVKDMSGKFRVVKNGMHEAYNGPSTRAHDSVKNILIIPPSEYSANFYDTTPEDWTQNIKSEYKFNHLRVRTKSTAVPLSYDLEWCDGVIAFNSMVTMSAVLLGKPVMDTHGLFKTDHVRHYLIEDLRKFYEPKQFTLNELKEGKCAFT